MLPTSIDFFMAFFGILYAGAIPVPIYPPMRLSQLEDHLRRQIGILRNAGACMLITMPEGRRLADLLRAQVESLRAVDCIADIEAAKQSICLSLVIRNRSFLSNTRRAARGIRKAWRLVMLTCWPTSARWA